MSKEPTLAGRVAAAKSPREITEILFAEMERLKIPKKVLDKERQGDAQ